MFQLPALSSHVATRWCTSLDMIEDERRSSVNAGFPFNSDPISTAPQFLSARRQHQTAALDPMQTDENELPVGAVTTAAAVAPTPPATPTPPAACEEAGLGSTKRKKRMMCVDASPPLPPPPTAVAAQQLNPFSLDVAVPGAAAVGDGVAARDTETAATAAAATATIASKAQKLPCGSSDEGHHTSTNIDLSISCLEGSTMNIPLSGKTVPFRVVKRRGMGISSVVFECEREHQAPPAAVAGVEGELGDDGPRVVTIKVGCVCVRACV